jgi:hypothetical protein
MKRFVGEGELPEVGTVDTHGVDLIVLITGLDGKDDLARWFAQFVWLVVTECVAGSVHYE